MTTYTSLYDLLGIPKYSQPSCRLEDGVYDVTDIPRLLLHEEATRMSAEATEEVKAFIAEHGAENVIIAQPYAMEWLVLLARRPAEVKTWRGGFNNGTGALITNCPREILILAEND